MMKGHDNKTHRNQLYGQPDYKTTKACPLGVTPPYPSRVFALYMENRNSWLENQMVRAIPFWKLRKMRALLRPFSLWRYFLAGRSPNTSNFIVFVYAQDFHPGGLCNKIK